MSTKIKHTNKLIRDNIPETIKAKGAKFSTRVLSEDEYMRELKQKLVEEAKEVQVEQEDLTGELADVLELVENVAKANGITLDEVETRKLQKRQKNGGFDKKLYLEWVEEN